MSAVPLLLQAALPLRDTVVTVVARDGLATAVDVATVILVLALFLLVGVILGLLLAARRAAAKGMEWVRTLPIQEPLAKGGHLVENLDEVITVIRRDVERVSASVDRLSGRLDQASDRMEERIEDFNALLEVVQTEAEELFVDTAARLRGSRASARRLREAASAPSAPAPSLPEVHPDARPLPPGRGESGEPVRTGPPPFDGPSGS